MQANASVTLLRFCNNWLLLSVAVKFVAQPVVTILTLNIKKKSFEHGI
jgi:hypothetical protein